MWGCCFRACRAVGPTLGIRIENTTKRAGTGWILGVSPLDENRCRDTELQVLRACAKKIRVGRGGRKSGERPRVERQRAQNPRYKSHTMPLFFHFERSHACRAYSFGASSHTPGAATLRGGHAPGVASPPLPHLNLARH